MSKDDRPLLLLTKVMRSPVLSPTGERLGRVDDVIASLTDRGYPHIAGLKISLGKRELFVPASMIADLTPGRVELTGQTLNLGRFERRTGEVLLRADVLGRRLIDVVAGRLVHANDLALANVEDSWRLVGVLPGRRGPTRGLLRRKTGREPTIDSSILDWGDVQPFVGHVPTAGLLMPLGPLKRLHPAQIADLVELSSHDEGGEIIDAVEADPELSADVFEELDAPHQEEFLEERTNEEAAALLSRMESDDAADLLNELDQNRRLPVLDLLPAAQRQRVHALLQYHPSTAGGMMSPDFIAVPPETVLSEVLARVRDDEKTPVPLRSMVFVIDKDGRFAGAVSVVDVIRNPAASRIDSVPTLVTTHLHVQADLADIALLMTDFNLMALAVIDDASQLIGAISVDDLLEALVPQDWRRRAQAQASD